MTPAIQSAAAGGAKASAGSPPGAAPLYAYVESGQLFIMESGRYIAATRRDAFWLWFEIHDSPYASTQERARQIRAAMDEAYPQDIAA